VCAGEVLMESKFANSRRTLYGRQQLQFFVKPVYDHFFYW